MRVVILRGRVSIGSFLLGGVFVCLIEGCSEDSMYLFFSFFFRYIILVHEVLWPFIDIHCTFLLIYIDVCFSFTYPFICCFFSPLIYMFLKIVCNLLFLSHTKMLWWVLFKVFQKIRLSKSSCHKLSSYKVFQVFVLG